MSASNSGHELFVQQITYVYGALAVINDGRLADVAHDFILSRVGPWVPRLGATRIRDLAATAFEAVASDVRSTGTVLFGTPRFVDSCMALSKFVEPVRALFLRDLVELAAMDGAFSREEVAFLSALERAWKTGTEIPGVSALEPFGAQSATPAVFVRGPLDDFGSLDEQVPASASEIAFGGGLGALPAPQVWWLEHLGAITDSTVEKGDAVTASSRTGRHQRLWSEANAWVDDLIEGVFGDSAIRWVNRPNQFQIGRLSYTYWARICPDDSSELGDLFHIGLQISKQIKWVKKAEPSLASFMKQPVIALWASTNDRTIEQLGRPDLHEFYGALQRDLLRSAPELWTRGGALVRAGSTLFRAANYLREEEAGRISAEDASRVSLFSPLMTLEDIEGDPSGSAQTVGAYLRILGSPVLAARDRFQRERVVNGSAVRVSTQAEIVVDTESKGVSSETYDTDPATAPLGISAEDSCGDMLIDLLRSAGVVADDFDPFDASCSTEAENYVAPAVQFVDGIRKAGEIAQLSPDYLEAIIGRSRLLRAATSAEKPLEKGGPIWYTGNCSVLHHQKGEQPLAWMTVFTIDGVFFLEDPDDEASISFFPWVDLPHFRVTHGFPSSTIVLMDDDYEEAFTIAPFTQSLSAESFAMADAVLTELLILSPDSVFSSNRGRSNRPEWTVQRVREVLALAGPGATHSELEGAEAYDTQFAPRSQAFGDMLVDFLQISGLWPAEISPTDRFYNKPLPKTVLAACDRLFMMLEANPELWLEVGPDLNEQCSIITNVDDWDVLPLNRLDELPGLEDYPWHKRGPLWYTSGITINSMYTGPMIFLRDGWIGVDPADEDSYRFNSWDNFLTHQWPAANGDGETYDSLMELGDLELDFDTAGSPPWKALNLRLADILLRRILPAARRSLGRPDISTPPIGQWTVHRVRTALLGED